MNSIKNSPKFDSIIKELANKLFQRKLSEITTTASIDTYQTPYAFSKKGMKKKRKKILRNKLDISLLMKLYLMMISKR